MPKAVTLPGYSIGVGDRFAQQAARNVTTNLYDRHIQPIFLERP